MAGYKTAPVICVRDYLLLIPQSRGGYNKCGEGGSRCERVTFQYLKQYIDSPPPFFVLYSFYELLDRLLLSRLNPLAVAVRGLRRIRTWY